MENPRPPSIALNGTAAPCRQCEQRGFLCWDACYKYAAFKAQLAREQEDRHRRSDRRSFELAVTRKLKCPKKGKWRFPRW